MDLRGDLRVSIVMAALAFLTSGCGIADLGRFAEFQHKAQGLFVPSTTPDSLPIPLPIVFIPGIKGSQLFRCASTLPDSSDCETEEEVWGTSGDVSSFRQFNDLFLDYRKTLTDFGGPGDTIPDPTYYRNQRIREKGVLYKYKLGYRSYIPLLDLGSYDVYDTLRQFLISEGHYQLEKTLFFLPYDWRLDNRIAAVKLALMLDTYRQLYEEYIRVSFCTGDQGRPCSKQDLETYLSQVRKRRTDIFTVDGKMKFILVGHSMGGLVARYFVTALAGGRDVHKVVLLGAPLYGSVEGLKALHDGEFPDTVLGYLGIHWFDKAATRPIEFSFSSLFQLLPTYPGSVSGETLESLGLELNQPLDDFEDRVSNKIYEAYRRANFVPGQFRLDFMRDYKHMESDEYSRIMRRHLFANLRSAQCFKRAMRITGADENTYLADLKNCKEAIRVNAAAEFLRKTNYQLAKVPRTLGDDVMTSSGKDQRVRTVIYAGHCKETVVQAKFNNGEVTFLSDPDTTTKGNPSDELTTGKQYGDGRVSVFGTGVLNPKLADSNFFLCADHVEIVKKTEFQYNLLRELLIN